MRFIDACRGHEVDTTPVWIMRQAGRYLPEYRELRTKAEFIEMYRTPSLAVEATLQPMRRFDLDAAILFSDILTLLEPLGVDLEFIPHPKIANPIRDRSAMARLKTPDVNRDLAFVFEAVAKIRATLPADKALIGFAGAPFTMATYMVEGNGSKEFLEPRTWMYRDPTGFSELLDRLVSATVPYLAGQIRAGADAVQIFDSWAGLLPPPEYEKFALEPVRRIVEQLKPLGVPIIYFVNGVAPFLNVVRQSSADVIGVDYRIDLGAAIAALGNDVVVQGNLDPAALLGPLDVLGEKVSSIVKAGMKARGHIFNLGHGITRFTDPDSVAFLVERVHSEGRRGA